METRKVQMVGGGTYTVSLPKAWAESEGLTTGDVVALHSHIDGVLVIQACDCGQDALERVSLSVADDSTARIERTLRAAYAAGFEETVLESETAFTDAQHRIVERVVGSLSGVTIAETSGARVTVRALLEPDEVSIRQSVRQLRFLALSMHEDAAAALTGEARAMADRADQVDRHATMVHRHFVRGLSRLDEIDALGLTRPELFVLWATSRELERVAGHAATVAALAAGIGDETPAGLREFAAAAHDVVADAVGVVVDDMDAGTALRTLDVHDRLCAEADALDRKLPESAAPQIVRILDRLRRTVEHGGTVAELAVQAAVRRGDLTAPAESGAE